MNAHFELTIIYLVYVYMEVCLVYKIWIIAV